MSLELYNDRVIFSIWNARTRVIEDDFEIDDERDFGGVSHRTQLKRMVSHWCQDCECAFRKEDVPATGFLDRPICPVCGNELAYFDLEEILPDETDDSWMFPNGHDDGESIDEMPWDK